MDQRIKIACVLKTGGEYNEKHVRWLQKQVRLYVSIPYEFVCLTDSQELDDISIPLLHNWPNWWSKIELFRPDIGFENVFYMDLDTVLTGNIDHILTHNSHKFMALHGALERKKDPQTDVLGSGLMRWRGDYSYIYENFDIKEIGKYNKSNSWGDQGYIKDCLPDYAFFQYHFPNEIVSWKADLNQVDKTDKSRIVFFHGKPRPWDVNRPWIFEL